MKHSEILAEARKKIASKKVIHVCIALRQDKWKEPEKVVELIDRISDSMGDWAGSGVGLWLHQHVGIPAKQITDKRMREYRLRWLDQLIAEYKEIGK